MRRKLAAVLTLSLGYYMVFVASVLEWLDPEAADLVDGIFRKTWGKHEQ